MKSKHYLMIGLATLVFLIGQNNPADATHNRPISDKDRLNMALEYFQSEKYHEALLLFQKLDQEYLLNQRYKAYIGVCYYHLWKYEQACLYLDSVMPSITVFAPHEQSVYYYANAESHFQFRLGFCYLFRKDWENALEYFESARSYYQHYGYKPGLKYRMTQIENMINGCKQQIDQSTGITLPSDSAK